jgi:hypothetical protein
MKDEGQQQPGALRNLLSRLWYGLWALVGLWLLHGALVPAPIRGARVNAIGGAGPYSAELDWSYGAGARPLSIIFDLEAGAAKGSLTTNGAATEAGIPLGMRPRGPYQLSVSATYRILGRAVTRVTTTAGVI